MSSDNQTPVQFSDEMIRRFLLGDLSSSEQPAFEENLFSDEDLEVRVRRAEFALADDYAYDRLNQAERGLFEKKFAVSADRRRQAAVSSVLRERFASASVASSKAGVVASFRGLFVSRPAWRWAFGVALLLILFGTALLVVKEPRLPQEIANKLIPRRRAPRSAPREVNHPTNDSLPVHQETPSPLPPHDLGAATTVTVGLAADDTEALIVNVPQGAQDVVRFQLAVPADQQGPFKAELFASDGQSVSSAEALKASTSGAPVDLDVPATALRPGNYQIKLSRDNSGAKESVGSYRFRVQ